MSFQGSHSAQRGLHGCRKPKPPVFAPKLSESSMGHMGCVDIHPPASPAQRGTKLPLAGLEEGCPSEQQSQFGRTSQHPAKPALTSPAVMKHS